MRSLVVLFLVLAASLLTCTDKKPSEPIVTDDLTPPARITTIWICDSAPTWADLCWYAVGDDSLTGRAQTYDVRLSQSPIAESNFSSCQAVEQSLEPRAPKVGERLRITGLDSGVVYFVAIKTSDDAGNWSAMSPIITLNSRDSLPPTTIIDFDGYLVNDSLLRLTWTAPRDSGTNDPAFLYEIRYFEDSLDNLSWAQSPAILQIAIPGPPGTFESLVTPWPSDDSSIYCAIRSRDNNGNLSSLSNVTRVSLASDTIIVPPDTTIGMSVVWERECGIRLGQIPVDMVVTTDGGIILASNWASAGNDDIVIVRLDSIGHQEWECHIDNGRSEWVAGIFVDPNGDYVAVGSSTSLTDTLGDLYIAKITPSGTLVEDRSFGEPGWESVRGAAMLDDGSLVIVGATTTAVPAQVALVVRTDASGNELWRDHVISYNSCFDGGQYGTAHAEDVDISANGIISVSTFKHYVVITGHTGCGPPEEVVSLYRWMLDGTRVSKTDYGPTGFLDGNYPGDVVALMSGNVAACMTAASENFSFRIQCMDPSGSPVWHLLLPGYDVNTTVLVPLSGSENVVVAGTAGEAGYWSWGIPSDPRMVLLDQMGNPQGFLVAGTSGTIETCYTAEATGHNSFVFAWRKPDAFSERIIATKVKVTATVD